MKYKLVNVKKSGRAMKTTIPAAMLVMILVLANGLSIVGGAARTAMVNPPITVTTLADENDGIGVGTGTSLREAIAAAAPGDTIDFDTVGVFATPQTITLTLGQIELYRNVTIQGPGASQLTVSGGDVSRVFYIRWVGPVTLDGLTVTGGNAVQAGGILSELSTLTVSNCIVSGNSAVNAGGGILNYAGTLAVSNCTVSGNSTNNAGCVGGGIYSERGTLTVSNSTISENSSFFGGGILNNAGTVTVSNSTVSRNSAANAGGGILNDGGTINVTACTISGNFSSDGGGIQTTEGLNVTNSTISGNRATGSGGGIYVNSGPTMITSSTVTGNEAGYDAGGIFRNNGVVMVGNSIIAANRSNTTTPDVGGATIYSSGFNLIGSSPNTGVFSPTAGDQVGTTGSPIDPLLGPLASNGGLTQTHKLAANSPAINAGSDALAVDASNNPLAFDQRGTGFPRIVSGTVDIGAFELDNQPPGVMINQAVGQSDPTAATLVNFTAVFNEPVSGFSAGDVMVSVSAGGATTVVSQIAPNDGTTYNVAVTLDQCARGVTITASIPAGVANDATGNANTASTSTDNTMTVNQNCTGCARGGAPQLSCPGDLTVVATGPAGAVVSYTPPTCLDCFCDSMTPTQTAGLLSGSTFPIGTTLNTYQVTDGGMTSTCTFSVTVLSPEICPQPQGYWKNNPTNWPVMSLQLGGASYNQFELLTILNTPAGTGRNADASLILAYQLIAAKLNVASGSNSTPINATISAADALLATYSGKLPYRVKPSSAAGNQMTALGVLLDQYNIGQLTPGCAP